MTDSTAKSLPIGKLVAIGAVASLTMTSAGSGYTSAPTITAFGGSGTGVGRNDGVGKTVPTALPNRARCHACGSAKSRCA